MINIYDRSVTEISEKNKQTMSKKDEAALEAVLQYLVQQNRPYSAQVVLWIRDILVRIRIRGSLH